MYPELFRIGGFPVNTYGVLLALAFLAALFVAARLAERDGLPRERVFDLGLWMLLGGLVGSKLLLMLAEPEYGTHWRNLLSIDFLRSGGVWYGGFLGGLLTAIVLMRRYKLPFWKATDAFAPGVALGQAIGRQGCFAAGCCWGKPTSVPFGVHFTDAGHQVTNVPTTVAQLSTQAEQTYWAQKLGGLDAAVHLHPTQLYESLGALLIFLFLFWLHRRKRFTGQVIATYAVLYGLMRFLVEFVRDDPRGDIWGLTTLTGLSTSQLISLLVVAGGVVFLFLRARRAKSDGTTAPATQADAAASA
ncbi:MAG TPA: prolipoprotein diacylglyceryl transferase [Pyrinomonadaceae bacterium]|nr:prolipoprotein diacylglyceryl transferase [Pyrinomonadaceae bacterium]